ncbi:MAG: WbqC family protein [Candidatus Ozemobacteraceae bacterium]
MKKVAILQSNYIPWKGYFDIINSVDSFIFLDDVQYTKLDWRNRNKIKTEKGFEWLTIPCGKNKNKLICEVELKDNTWQEAHWNKILYNYKKAEFFYQYKDFFESFYLANNWTNLSVMNQYLIMKISKEFLGIETVFEDSRKYHLTKRKGERVIELLKKVHADVYLSGPAAKNYLMEEEFVTADIELSWMDYSEYPEYHQFYPPFEHQVSILDLLFHEGPRVPKYLKSFSK